MSLAWQCFDEQPKVDFNKLAVLAGMSAGGASNAWRAIKKKLAEQAGNVAAGNGAGTPKRTPSKPKATPKKRGKKASDEDEEDDEEIGTPAPKVCFDLIMAIGASSDYKIHRSHALRARLALLSRSTPKRAMRQTSRSRQRPMRMARRMTMSWSNYKPRWI